MENLCSVKILPGKFVGSLAFVRVFVQQHCLLGPLWVSIFLIVDYYFIGDQLLFINIDIDNEYSVSLASCEFVQLSHCWWWEYHFYTLSWFCRLYYCVLLILTIFSFCRLHSLLSIARGVLITVTEAALYKVQYNFLSSVKRSHLVNIEKL